jgi:hypothetical protein
LRSLIPGCFFRWHPKIIVVFSLALSNDLSAKRRNMDQAEENPIENASPASSSASRGGAARMSHLDLAGRKALGRKAAEARWRKKEQGVGVGQQMPAPSEPANSAGIADTQEAPPLVTTPATVDLSPKTPPVRPARRAARLPVRPAPKEFRGAHSYAEKRLAEAIKERAQAMHKLSMLEAEIPSLVQIIRALQNTPQSAPMGAIAPPQLGLGLTAVRPPLINRAQGGAGLPGIGNPVEVNEDEDVFLRESPVAQGEWH